MISKFKTFKTHQRLLFSTSFHNPSSSFQPHSKPINDCISSLCRQKRYKEAISSFHSLQLHNPTPQLYPSTYTHLFIACSHLKSLHNARDIHHHLISHLNPHADVILSNHILNTYGKCGSVADARKLFDSMHERNLISWASMISGYSQNSKEIEAISLYLEMLRAGLSPDQFCLGSVVRVCPGLSDIELGRQLHCQVVKMDYSSDRSVKNAFVTMYSKFGKVGDASVVFERIEEKDFVSWGAMITGFAQQGFDLEAALLFREMVGMGVYVPNEYHFGSVFSACGGISRLEYGEQIHGLCLKFGLASDEFAGCSLSKMYARLGRLECATSAFFQIEMPDLASWNSIISPFSDEGYINESIRFFSNMRNMGVKTR